MSRSLSDLVEAAIAGCYHYGLGGHRPWPRRIPKIGQVDLPDPTREQSTGYEALKRHRERRKPIGWPFGKHSLIDLEEHLRIFLGETEAARLILDRSETYIAAWRHNIANASPRLADGARAFLELWHRCEQAKSESCDRCKKRVETREKRSCKNASHGLQSHCAGI